MKRSIVSACLCGLLGSTSFLWADVATDRIFMEQVIDDSASFSLTTHYFSNDGSGTDFYLDGTELFADTLTLGLDAFWYLVDEGDVFTQAAIEAGMFERISFNPGDVEITTVDIGPLADHYFGVRGEDFFDFGWVKIRLSGDQPVVLGSALTDSSRGIIVGTLDIVPEPSTSCGLGFVLLSILSMRRRRRS